MGQRGELDVDGVGRWSSRPVLAVLGVSLAVALLASTFRLVADVRDGFHTEIAGFLLDPNAARDAAEYMNQRVTPTDLVIASPALAWMLPARVADMQMPIAYRGQATPHLPGNVPAAHWAFNPSIERARYVILDNLRRNWAVPIVPGVADMLHEIGAWPIVFQAGEIVIYQNPEE